MKTCFFFIVISFISVTGYSQTGPGGVGSNDGSSYLDIWLSDSLKYSDAGSTLANNGDNIQQWNDISGNSNHATQTIASKRPTCTTHSFNDYTVAEFYDDRLNINYDISPSVHANITVIAVVDINSSTTSTYLKVFGHDDGNYDRCSGIDDRCPGGAETFTYFDGSTSINGVGCFMSPPGNTAFVFSASYSSSYFNGWYNGTHKVNSANVTNGDGQNSLSVGSIGSLYNEYWEGGIAEFILFNRILNDAENLIIHNSLAAKYDISISNDIYTRDDAANGDFDFDVAGIGRVDASNLHNDARGTDIVRILNPSGLGDNEFLIWGNDHGDLKATNKTDIPAGVQARFDREWRVNESDVSGTAVDVGSIDIRFDLSGLGTVVTSDLRLLVDTDNDGIFADETPIPGATSLGSGVYQFGSVTAITNNVRFTIATSDTTQTLPIELVSFEIDIINNQYIKLYWQTASEINNNYFLVERSKDGINWGKLTKITGAGNSSTLLNYSFLDKNPLPKTSYYRIKQIDFDSYYSFSEIKTINLAQSNRKVTVYPNPVNQKITIIEENQILQNVIIYNTLGEDVTNHAKQLSKSFSQMVFDLSALPDGLYFIVTNNSVTKISKLSK